MREFFRGWKRKAGCVTLMLACVFVAGWVRSLLICDEYVINDYGCGSRSFLRSKNGEVRYILVDSIFREEQTTYRSNYVTPTLPLTLLSAYLLISKLKQSKPSIEQKTNA